MFCADELSAAVVAKIVSLGANWGFAKAVQEKLKR